MGAKIIAGVVVFVALVVFVQSFVLGGDEEPLETPDRTGLAPTATLPAELPEPVSLGESSGDVLASTDDTEGEPAGNETYVVQSGDTLATIAASFEVAPEDQAGWIAEVLELNGLADARSLQEGQELTVPGAPRTATDEPGAEAEDDNETPEGEATETPDTSDAEATSTPEPDDAEQEEEDPDESPTPTPEPSGGGGTYTVVSGDTPLGIAAAHCVEDASAWVDELAALNGVDANNLALGAELQLPASTPGC